MAKKRSHHFRGIAQYAEKLMDLAEGQPVFQGRGQKPSNKEVLKAIAAIEKCQKERAHGSFFTGGATARAQCSCGWHTKAVARKASLQGQSSTSSIIPGPVALEPPLAPAGGRRNRHHSPVCQSPSFSSSSGPLKTYTDGSSSPPPLPPPSSLPPSALPLSSSTMSSVGSSRQTPPLAPAGSCRQYHDSPVRQPPSFSSGPVQTYTDGSSSPPPLPPPLSASTMWSVGLSGPIPPEVPLHTASVSSSLSLPAAPPTSVSSSSSLSLPCGSDSYDSSSKLKAGSGPIPPNFDRCAYQTVKICDLREVGIGMKTAPSKLDLMIYSPIMGRCPHCHSSIISANSVGKTKLCYAVPWPKTVVGADMRCSKCHKHFMTHDPTYVTTLTFREQAKKDFVAGKGNGTHLSVIRLLRSGLTVSQVQRYIEDEVRQQYYQLKSQFLENWDKVDAMRGVGKVNVVSRDSFPPFPSHFVPCRPHLTAMFVKDYWENKACIMRELRMVVSSHSLAVDHQRKVVKRILPCDVVVSGGQTFTICGDFGVVLGVYVVPDTSLSWAKNAMEEVIERHKSLRIAVPQSLYMDNGCCNGIPRELSSQRSNPGTSTLSQWHLQFSIKLDAMHLMLRIGREINAEHPRRKKFLLDLSQAIFSQHSEDLELLMNARSAAGLEGQPTRTERVKYLRRVVGSPESVASRMMLVLNAHRGIDEQCQAQAKASGMNTDNLTVADVAYPLVTNSVMSIFQRQLIHVGNGCISDDPDRLPYVEVGTVDFHNTGHRLPHYQSLRGTSKVEAVHSVLDRTFYTQHGIGNEVFDARLGWWLLNYNRRRLRALGKKVPPDNMPPKVCEYYVSCSIRDDFPDWTIAAPGTESLLKIGFEYGRSVTGQDLSVDLDQYEESNPSKADIYEDETLVTTTAEAFEQLGFNSDNFEDIANAAQPTTIPTATTPTTNTPTLPTVHGTTTNTPTSPTVHGGRVPYTPTETMPTTISTLPIVHGDVSDVNDGNDVTATVEGISVTLPVPTCTSTSFVTTTPVKSVPTTTTPPISTTPSATTPTVPSWKDSPLPSNVTPSRRRNVARFRSMGGDSTCVPPDFNQAMLVIWEELWNAMPQSGKVNLLVNDILMKYKERCRIERKRERDSNRTPPPLLPVSFAQAKDWLIKQQRANAEALTIGIVNEESREITTELNTSLSDQSASTSALLQQPARSADPVIPVPQLSLGPEPVTNEVRAEERRELQEQGTTLPATKPKPAKKPAPKKKKTVSSEMQQRQVKAVTRMQQLGVAPISEKAKEGKRPCPVCGQLRTTADKTPNGLIHRVLGRSNDIWCPYADDPSVLQEYEKQQKERARASWKKAAANKKIKKQQQELTE